MSFDSLFPDSHSTPMELAPTPAPVEDSPADVAARVAIAESDKLAQAAGVLTEAEILAAEGLEVPSATPKHDL